MSDNNIDMKHSIPKYIIGLNWEKNGGITAKIIAIAFMIIPRPVRLSVLLVASSRLFPLVRSLNQRAEK